MEQLVNRLVEAGYLKTPRVIAAFRAVDRRRFVRDKRRAYEDVPLPIPGGQTISAPHMVALMLELLELKRTDRVLEIGAGCGYLAALASRLVKQVTAVEVDPTLAELARQNLARAPNVAVVCADGSRGYPGSYQKIVFSCAVPEIPEEAVGQLADPGILLAPVGTDAQELVLLRKRRGSITMEQHGGVAFVPLQKP